MISLAQVVIKTIYILPKLAQNIVFFSSTKVKVIVTAR